MEEIKTKPPAQNAELRSIEGEYRRGVAVIEARPKLESAAFVVWGMVDVFLIAFFFLATVLYLVSGSFADSRLMATLDNNIGTLNRVGATRAPESLVVGETTVLRHGEVTDAFTTIANTNSDWYTTFLLRSSIDDSESRFGFINPGEERTFPMFGLEDFSSRDRLLVTDVTWLRVDRHAIGVPSDWLEDRSNISIDDVQYSRSLTIGTSPISLVNFTVTNRTAFSYWQPVFVVRVLRGSTTIAVNEVSIPELVAGETRNVEVRFFGELPDSATAVVEPAIFYFDPSVYSDTPGGDSSPDIFETL